MEVQGGWKCPVCNFYNYPSRVVCYRCQAAQPGKAGAPGAGAGRGAFDAFPRGAYRGGFGRGFPFTGYGPFGAYSFGYGMRFRPRRITQREGDWFCGHCNTHNFASRDACRRCQKPKDGEARIVSAEMAAAAQPPRREGDWDCPKCQYMNYASRTECNRCHEKKPLKL